MKPSPKFGSMPNYSIYIVNGKMGLANGFNLIIQPKYDIIYPFNDKYAIVKLNGKYGLIDSFGKEIMPTSYGLLSHISKNKYWFIWNDTLYYNDFDLNIYNKKFKSEEFKDSISRLLNVNRDDISMYDFDECHEKYGIAAFEINEEQTYIYSEKRNKILLQDYEIIKCDCDTGIIIIGKNRKCGVADFNENIIIPPKYEHLSWSEEGLFPAVNERKWGFIDIYGNTRINFKYDGVSGFGGGKSIVCQDGKYGVIDLYGNTIVPISFDSIHFINGQTIVVKNGFWGKEYEIYGKTSVNLRQKYKEFYFNFQNNPDLVRVMDGNQYGIIRLNGDIILEPKYDFINFNAGNHIVVKQAGKYGIFDLYGKMLLPINYDQISRDEVNINGRSIFYYKVSLNKKEGLIDANMKLVFPIQYDSITYNTTYNAYVVKLNNEYAMLDLEHNNLIPFSNNYLE